MNTLKKLFGFSIGSVLGAVLSAISVPITTHLLYPNEYGKTGMFSLIYMILLMIAYLGYDQAYIREFHETDDKRKAMINSMVVPLAVTFCLMLIMFPFAGYISYFLFESFDHKDVIYLLDLCLPFLLFERFIMVKLRMQEKALQYSFFTLLTKVITFCCTLFFLFNIRKDFLAVVYSTIISHYVSDGVLIIIYHKMLKIKKGDIDKTTIIRMSKFALPLLPASVMGTIFNAEDKLFIKYFADYTELGYYQASMTLANMVLILQQAFSTFWTPTVFRWKSQNVKNERYEFVQKGVTLFGSICFIGVLFIKNLLPILLSAKYASSKYILPFLLFYPVMAMIISTTVLGMDFARKTQYTLYFSIVVVIVNFVLNFIFVRHLGAAGAAIATGLSHIVYFWIRTIVSRKLWFNFKIDHLIISTCLLSILALVNSLTFIDDIYVYLCDCFVLFCILFLYHNYIKEIFGMIKNWRAEKCLQKQ